MDLDLDLKLTEVLAIYAAILSTFVFFWNVLKSKRRIFVKLTYCLDGDGDDIQSGVCILIQNPSVNVIHVSGLSVLYPYRKTNFFDILVNSIKYRRWFSTYGWVHSSLSLYKLDDGCPVSIEPGHAHKVLIPYEILDELLKDAVTRKFMASVQDQLGNETCSKKFEVQEVSNEKESTTPTQGCGV